ncbi:MAG: hypothetical protein K5895_02485, partial [Lachnospiraceae bacterium]|nr:hypothetical protein [Lachnospiraceae bacterium]
TSREIYEIKPYNGVVDGAKQVKMYIEILQYMFGEGVFSPGTTWPIPARVYEWPLGGAITVYLDQPGVIHYHLTRSEGIVERSGSYERYCIS